MKHPFVKILYGNTPTGRWTRCILLFLIFSLLFTPIGFSQDKKPELPGPSAEYENLADSIDNTTRTEKEHYERIQDRYARSKEYQKALSTEINAYNILLSVRGNLLLQPRVQIESLQKGWGEIKLAADNIDQQLKELSDEAEAVAENLEQVVEKLNLNKKQLSDIRSEPSKFPKADTLIQKLRSLIQVLTNKQTLLKKTQDLYLAQIKELEAVNSSLSELAAKFDARIKDQKKQQLFQRETSLFDLVKWSRFRQESLLTFERILELGGKKFWQTEFRPLIASNGVQAVTFLIAFAVTIAVLIRLRHSCTRLRRDYISEITWPWTNLGLKLIRNSALLLGIALMVYLFAQAKLIYNTVPVIRTIYLILMIVLLTRWGLEFIKTVYAMNLLKISISQRRLIRYNLVWVRFFSVGYVIMEWLIGSSGIILMSARLFLGLSLLLWTFVFLKTISPEPVTEKKPCSMKQKAVRLVLVRLLYIVILGGPVLDLAGYSSLAHYWFVSWGRTVIIGLWGLVLFKALREWETHFQDKSTKWERSARKPGHSIQWLLIQLCRLLWFAGIFLSLVLAWGARQTVIVNMFKIIHYRWALGQMRISIMGLIYGAIVLLLTMTGTRIWRYSIQEKMFRYSGMDTGLKESVTSIITYMIWAVGILMAFYAVGLNTTSLVVALGALGIGLGFGLQNIFNNFISGLILLFERPIQVGDAIEINKIWGVVKKINVRSTLVQTYDNASLIIPNSEFISAQVTNWSFKDMRIRRKISVGVAYGSDIQQVRETLLKVADNVPRVLKYPKPDVLFSDFGDSALMFTLRIWTMVDEVLATETDVRFELNRLFRELNIEIAFPQLDIHMRTEQPGTDKPSNLEKG